LLALEADPVTRGVPVILLTAKVQAGLRQVWEGLPVRGVIGKPFNPMTLTSDIERYLRHPDERFARASADGQRSA
jgi:CheY-like chemotaxis protein